DSTNSLSTAVSLTVIGGAPTITSFTPTSGPVGTRVTISGTNFTGATTVTFNGVSASFTVTSATTIQATVPTGATTGPLSVTTPGGTGTSANVFTVIVTLTVTKVGTGSGIVTSSPAGINCGATCSGSYSSGTVVTLIATPDRTSATTSQATVPTGATTGPLSVTTPGGTGTSANVFTVIVTLTVTKVGTGSGIVTSSPAGINCGATCSGSYSSGTVVTLIATPAFDSMFAAWSGCDAASGTTCSVTMSTARTVTANFLP